VEFLAFCDSYLAFYPAILHVEACRYQRQALFTRGGFELFDFAAVQQKLARTGRRMVETITVAVLADVRVQ
jgi:hypothetical protein